VPTASGDGHARRSTSDDVDQFYITRGGEPFRYFSRHNGPDQNLAK
jgi:hypothetical protein